MSAKLTRLATIRDLFGPRENGGYCECSHCVAGRELLAVVEAALGGTTPKQNMLVCAVSIGLETDDDAKAALRREHDAWEKLT